MNILHMHYLLWQQTVKGQQYFPINTDSADTLVACFLPNCQRHTVDQSKVIRIHQTITQNRFQLGQREVEGRLM